MKLAPSFLSLISLVLWEGQTIAQTPPVDPQARGGNLDATDRGDPVVPNRPGLGSPPVVPYAESAKGDEEEKASARDAEPLASEIEPVRTFEALHANSYRQASGADGQIVDQASFQFLNQTPTVLTQRALDWDLGISSEYSTSVKAGLNESRLWGRHKASFGLLEDYRSYKGSGARLEEIYQAANRLLQDFTKFKSPETTRQGAAVRLGDEIKVGSESLVKVDGEIRQDALKIDKALEEGSTYESLAVLWRLGLGKNRRIESSFHRSLVLFKDQRNNLSQSQDLNEYETQLIGPLSSLYLGGLGFRSLDGKRNGPLFSLVRLPDARLEGQLKVSYLKDAEETQTLASLTSRYKWTRLLSMNLRIEQGVDLLAAYSSQTTANQSQARDQRLNRSFEITWVYEHRYSNYTLAVSSSSQEYETARFAQEGVSFGLDHRINALDSLILSAAYRAAQEGGQVQRVIDKRYALVDGAWRHFWGYDTRLFGGRSFGQLGASFERVWEGDRKLERQTISLAFGQEWK